MATGERGGGIQSYGVSFFFFFSLSLSKPPSPSPHSITSLSFPPPPHSINKTKHLTSEQKRFVGYPNYKFYFPIRAFGRYVYEYLPFLKKVVGEGKGV